MLGLYRSGKREGKTAKKKFHPTRTVVGGIYSIETYFIPQRTCERTSSVSPTADHIPIPTPQDDIMDSYTNENAKRKSSQGLVR